MPRGPRVACCVLGLALLLAASGSAARVKFSEGSRQAAYPAGLGAGLTRVAASPRVVAAPRTASQRCVAALRALGSSRVAYAALVKRQTVIRNQPRHGGHVVGRIALRDVNGFRQVLGVVAIHSGRSCVADWYRVQLSVLPNGTVGWVRAWAVQTYRVRSRIEVDVSERSLRLFRAGKLAFEAPVGVGAPATPTPLGRYFVNERYVLPDASGPFGPDALGISAHSNVLQHVWVEDGPIAIHGTNEPWSIGEAASHGCIHVANDVMRRLFPLAPAGTPVIVTA